MATVGLYGSSSSGVVAAASGSESIGLYGNGTNFGGSYFEWFIFQVADTQPATPTGGSWDFTTNTGTPPAGWSVTPPANPTNTVWVSIALVNSKNATNLTWSAPGKFSYSSGLPILSGNGTPGPSVGQSDQLYIQLDTTPQTIWFKESGTWTRLTGSTLYVDTTSNQTIAGTKTFSSQIQGSVSGTAANVTGIVGIANGGTGSTTASGARTALGAAASGANSDITSLSGLTTALSVAQGGTGATTANGALSNLGGIGTITSTDGSITVTPAGTTVNLAVSQDSPASTLLTPVRNTTGATLTKGTVVYISGATGQIATVSKAIATSDATSAQTLGMITSDLPNNTNGYVTVFGLLSNMDTSAYTDGAQLYLSGVTAGTVTATKPSAPTHLVYVAVVEYAHPTQGKLLVKVQNGYELEELHNVSITSPATGQTIIYNSGTNLWSNSTVSLTAGVNGTLPIANGGTGQTTANAAFNALVPSQVGNSGKFLTTDGTNTSWATNPLGTVTSVDVSGGTTGLTTSGGPITTSGTITLAGTLGIANGGTGATTAAGAATNLGLGTGNSPTFTGLTLSGGTANGVAYLNGSKVVTTGSALTFDGTNLGIGVASASYGVDVRGASGVGVQIYETSTGNNNRLIVTQQATVSTYNSTFSTGSGAHAWQLGGSEQMRLNSTGLGIGTSSPAAKLEVSGGDSLLRGGKFIIGPTAGGNGAGAIRGTLNGVLGSLIFQTENSSAVLTDVATLDASGNLGLGVTPSAWYQDAGPALQINKFTLGQTGGFDVTSFITNGYYSSSGAYKYIGSAAVAMYQQYAGGHRWHIAPSGTAGSAISFTQAMTLDASGWLGVGITAPAAKLHISGSLDSTFNSNVLIEGSSTIKIAFNPFGGLSSGFGGLNDGSLAFYGNGANTERARIDTSGNLLVGTTDNSTNQQGYAWNINSGGSFGRIGHANGTASGTAYLAFQYNGGVIGTITQSGTTAVLYNVTSDQRLKENIVDAPEFGSVIDSIKVRSYDWKADGNHQRAGFIAQELVTVAPEAVHQPADPEEMMAVDYSKLVPMLVKEIQSLRTRVAQLEGK